MGNAVSTATNVAGAVTDVVTAVYGGPSWWERLLYTIFLAFWRAYFDTKQAQREADQEIPDDLARARALRFRAAVQRLRDVQGNPAGPVDPAPAGGAGAGNPVVR